MVEFDSNTFCSCKKGQYLKELRCYACHYSCSYCFNHYEDGCFECINKLRNLNKQPEKYG